MATHTVARIEPAEPLHGFQIASAQNNRRQTITGQPARSILFTVCSVVASPATHYSWYQDRPSERSITFSIDWLRS
jgi:hypothetical protein